jgi:hypothetical protein
MFPSLLYIQVQHFKNLFNFNGFLVVQKHITIYNFKLQGLPFICKHFIFESWSSFVLLAFRVLFQVPISKSFLIVVLSFAYLKVKKIEKLGFKS